MTTRSSILAWRIPWTEEPGGLQSMGSQRVRHNCATKPPPLKILPLTPYYHLLFSQYKISLLFSLILQLVKLGSRQGFHLSCSLCHSVQFRSFAQSCPTLFNPMNCSTPGLPIHHLLPEFTQTHVHRVGDATVISSSVVPFSSCPQSLPASGPLPMSQLFA